MDNSILNAILTRLAFAGTVVAIGIAAYLVGLTVYRLWFHPLASFPGPLLNRISWLPGALWTLRGRLPMETRKLHDMYGPVVRLSPNELAFNTPQAWTDIYGHRPGRLDLEKDPMHVGAVDSVPGVSTISMADRENHARQRKALSHGFSKRALWEQEATVQGFVDRLITRFHEFADTGKTFDIVRWYNFATFDIIGDLSFGESFGCLETGDFHFWIGLILGAVKAGAIEQASRRFATPGSWLQQSIQRWSQGKLKKQRSDHLEYSRKKVMKRMQNTKTDRKDFIHYILKQGEHYDLSQDEVIVNAALFIVAGSETTASALAALTNFLLRHPRVYAKLKDEIRSTFADEEDITLAAMDKLAYLNACLEEGLRMFPPAPIGFLRTIQPQGDVIGGYQIPGGTAVSVSSWCASHSADNFRDPDSFVPERWLDSSSAATSDPESCAAAAAPYKTDKKLASRPFSMGPRGCIGKDLSYVEQRLVMARMVWNFDLEPTDDMHEWDPEDNMKNILAYGTWQKPGLRVVARDRRMAGSKFWRKRNGARGGGGGGCGEKET
ncbi:cytochrome P450 [Microdochium trichocladiopsis]|uniref:Cytochrome P450 n=1 Tax=Microdochium trichocladiopsis TaxID=1682393 RepID=A0A9P8YDU7_9PEZI|nr:cytochrome P450 [Microdochium trichocladiopsis]KAH7037429.1 cytochrome P450 [Microdochium trichocladiopsis]